MSDVLKVAAAGMIAAICAMVVRRQVPELALLLTLSAGVMILAFCSGALGKVVAFLDALAQTSGLQSGILTPVMKVTGIALVTQLAAHLCRDAQEGALAAAVETAGSVLALLCILPLMTAVLELMEELL